MVFDIAEMLLGAVGSAGFTIHICTEYCVAGDKLETVCVEDPTGVTGTGLSPFRE
jgi:hypothetical protein